MSERVYVTAADTSPESDDASKTKELAVKSQHTLNAFKMC